MGAKSHMQGRLLADVNMLNRRTLLFLETWNLFASKSYSIVDLDSPDTTHRSKHLLILWPPCHPICHTRRHPRSFIPSLVPIHPFINHPPTQRQPFRPYSCPHQPPSQTTLHTTLTHILSAPLSPPTLTSIPYPLTHSLPTRIPPPPSPLPSRP
jgi:hypothetical protein